MKPVWTAFGIGTVNQTHEMMFWNRELIASTAALWSKEGVLISPQKAIQLGFQGAPAAADFDGFDAAFGDIFEVGRPWNFKVHTGLFGGINDVLAVFTIRSVEMAIEAAVKAAAPVGFFSPIFTTSALHDVIIS